MKILLVAILSLNWAAGSGPHLQRGFESEGFSIANDLGSLEKTIDLSKECGIRAENPKARIEGGEEVVPHSIPWQVAIIDGNCGGTLISPMHVLTAAHCVRGWDPKEMLIGVGMHNITAEDGKKIAVQNITVPDDYSETGENGHNNYDNDFALVTLATPVDLNDKIRIACLPSERLGGNFLDGKNLTVSGWGFGSGDILKQVKIPGISNAYCQELYNTEREESCLKKGWAPTITKNHLCAGIPFPSTKAAGYGDSGGPLTYNDNGRETVVGVVSFGDKDCSNSNLVNGSVGVYARVTEKLEWIKKEMENYYD